MMTSTTRWVLAHKRIVAAAWILITLVGIASVGSATKAFSNKFSVPGREGFVTNARIARIYHAGGNYAPLVPVVTLPAGTPVSSPAVRAGLRQTEAKLRAAIPGTRTASFADTGNRAFVSADGRTTFVLAYPPPDNESFGNNTKAAKKAAAALAGDTIAGSARPCHRIRRAGQTRPAGAEDLASCSSRCWEGSGLWSCWPSCSPRCWPSSRC